MERYRCCGTVFSSQLALVNHRRGAKCLRHLVRPAVPQRGSAGPWEGCASPGAAQQGGAGGKGVGGVTHHTPPLHRSVVSPLVSPSWPPPPVVPSNKIDYRAVLLAMSARPGAAGGEHSEDCALGDEGYDRIGGVVSAAVNQGSRRCAAERCSACEPRHGPTYPLCTTNGTVAHSLQVSDRGCPLLPGNRHSPFGAHILSTAVNQGSRRCAAERCSACVPRHGPTFTLCTIHRMARVAYVRWGKVGRCQGSHGLRRCAAQHHEP